MPIDCADDSRDVWIVRSRVIEIMRLTQPNGDDRAIIELSAYLSIATLLATAAYDIPLTPETCGHILKRLAEAAEDAINDERQRIAARSQ
jgi:hypothetical protein